jgi:hypothetical protein
LSAIHYLTELNCSKKRILDDAPEHIITGPGNAWYTMRRAGYSVPVTRFVCWSAFRMHYAEGTSGSKTAIAGEIPARSCCREEWQAQRVPVCRALGHPTDGHKGVQQLAVQLDETWKPSHHALKEMRRFIFAMTVNILP